MARIARLAFVLALLLAFVVPSSAGAFTNGYAKPSEVSPIATGIHCAPLQGQLANQAAAGFNTMALAAQKRIPTSGCDSAYRPIARQVYWRNYWCSRGLCGNAAVPGTSNHGLGLATDVPQWVRAYIDQHGRTFGWCKCWSDAQQEWWHILFNRSAFGRPNPGPLLKFPVLRLHSGGPGQAPSVKKTQRLLRVHGAKKLPVDGDYGRRTLHAVKRFQRAENIKNDGVVGMRTWKHLRAPVVNPSPVPPPPTPVPRGPVSGIDVSGHNGSVDWAKVKHAGFEFAITKATEGEDWKDPSFAKGRLDEIKKYHLVPGVYHYLRPRSDRPGSKEATWFAQVITQAGFGRGFLPPVADIESTTLSPAGTCHYLHGFVGRVRTTLHVKPIIYTYPSFASQYLSGCAFLKDFHLWIAHYGVSKPTIPGPWHDYLMWQYTSTGHVSGVSGNVDVNKLPGGRKLLDALRVDKLPKQTTHRLSATVAQPLKVESIARLREEAPPAAKREPLTEVPQPEGQTIVPSYGQRTLADIGRVFLDLYALSK